MLTQHVVDIRKIVIYSSMRYAGVPIETRRRLAGGVMMGVIGDKPIGLHTAGVAGFYGGCLSCWGYSWLSPRLESGLNIQDICGVHIILEVSH